MTPKTVVVVGGGAAGAIAANLLARQLTPEQARIVVVDANGLHLFQPGLLDLALGQTRSPRLVRDVRRILHDRVDLIVDRARLLDPVARVLHLELDGALPYDFLVLATGARLDRDAIPGFSAAHDFYSIVGAERLRESLRRFEQGTVVIGIGGTPYRCPPAPVEFALLLEERLRRTGRRPGTRIDFLSPVARLCPTAGVSEIAAPYLDRRGITTHTFANIEEIDPEGRVIHTLEGENYPFDLAILVPPHRGSALVEDSGIGDEGGWVPTDPATLRVKGYERLFALGDTTDLPISKAGSTAHFEAPVVVAQIVAAVQNREPDPLRVTYEGTVVCFLGVGGRRATRLVLDYHGPRPIRRPSLRWHALRQIFKRAYWWGFPQGRFVRPR